MWVLIAMVYSGGARRVITERFTSEDRCGLAGQAVKELVELDQDHHIVDRNGQRCFAHYLCVKR